MLTTQIYGANIESSSIISNNVKVLNSIFYILSGCRNEIVYCSDKVPRLWLNVVKLMLELEQAAPSLHACCSKYCYG